MHFLSKEETGNWIEDYLNRQPAVARKRVEGTEKVIKQKQEDMGNTEHTGLSKRMTENHMMTS